MERTFGVLKHRWQILEKAPFFERDKQVQIIIACFALKNYLWECEHGREPSGTYPLSHWVTVNTGSSTTQMREYIKLASTCDINSRYVMWVTNSVYKRSVVHVWLTLTMICGNAGFGGRLGKKDGVGSDCCSSSLSLVPSFCVFVHDM